MVRVKLFANFREVAGVRELEIDANTIEEVLKKLVEIFPRLEEYFKGEKLRSYVHVMVNGEIVRDFKFELNNSDVVAIFPPVSGG